MRETTTPELHIARSEPQLDEERASHPLRAPLALLLLLPRQVRPHSQTRLWGYLFGIRVTRVIRVIRVIWVIWVGRRLRVDTATRTDHAKRTGSSVAGSLCKDFVPDKFVAIFIIKGCQERFVIIAGKRVPTTRFLKGTPSIVTS